jgi:excisionase family DNA binding protein
MACCRIRAMVNPAPLEAQDLLDVRDAAALIGRHPETVRRWVWSGSLPAIRQGKRLVVRRADLEARAGRRTVPVTLEAWAEHATRVRAGFAAVRRSTAADLVLEDRALRSGAHGARAGR